MKTRMAIATFALLVGAFTLSACSLPGSDSDDPTPAPTTATTTSAAPTPTVAPTISSAADLVGDWESKEAQWIVHFKSDGTFVADFQGLEDFLVGKYQLNGTELSLIGDDGTTDKGTVKGQSLIFRLGTLIRK